MESSSRLPSDPVAFIRRCLAAGRVLWTYHVNMRMQGRSITRRMILEAASSFEVIESNPHDRFLPSYLVYSIHGDTVIHVLFAADVANDNVRIVTAYRPTADRWLADMKTRRRK